MAEEYNLKPLERQFADEYIANGRNATQAYKHIRPKVKDTTAATKGREWVRKSEISRYISDKTVERLDASNLTAQDVLDELIKVGFGRPQKSYTKQYDILEDEVILEVEYTNTAKYEDRIKALELLGKSMTMWTDKQEISGDIAVTFVDDIGSDPDDS